MNYKFEWFDCTCSIVCPYCGKNIMISFDDEPKTCDCGHTFHLIAYVEEVKDET